MNLGWSHGIVSGADKSLGDRPALWVMGLLAAWSCHR